MLAVKGRLCFERGDLHFQRVVTAGEAFAPENLGEAFARRFEFQFLTNNGHRGELLAGVYALDHGLWCEAHKIDPRIEQTRWGILWRRLVRAFDEIGQRVEELLAVYLRYNILVIRRTIGLIRRPVVVCFLLAGFEYGKRFRKPGDIESRIPTYRMVTTGSDATPVGWSTPGTIACPTDIPSVTVSARVWSSRYY